MLKQPDSRGYPILSPAELQNAGYFWGEKAGFPGQLGIKRGQLEKIGFFCCLIFGICFTYSVSDDKYLRIEEACFPN